jgi:hypothetical protein
MPHASIGGIVLFAGAPPPADLELFLNPGLHARIAADAIFKFDRVPPGEYSVTFSNSAFTVSDLKADGIRIVDDLIEVPASGAVDLTVKAAGTETLANLRGVAIRDSRGARGAMVLLLPEDLRRGSLIRRDQSATDGSFRLTKIMPGGYTLIAIDDGRDLAYQEPSVIKNYLPGGLSITIPLEGNEQLKVPVQTRKR